MKTLLEILFFIIKVIWLVIGIIIFPVGCLFGLAFFESFEDLVHSWKLTFLWWFNFKIN